MASGFQYADPWFKIKIETLHSSEKLGTVQGWASSSSSTTSWVALSFTVPQFPHLENGEKGGKVLLSLGNKDFHRATRARH